MEAAMSARRLATAAVVLFGTAVAGCANAPPPSLEEARTAVQLARDDQDVVRYAPAELEAAQAELASADEAWEEGLGEEETAHRAMLAQQQAEVALAAAASRRSDETAEEELGRLEEELAELQARESERGLIVTLGDVLFDVGEATLRPGAARDLNRLAAALVQHPSRSVSVEGYTDSTGSDDFNQRLSQRRAETVRSALIAGGVQPERINAVGLGESLPVTSNATAAGRQQNRRVEVVILDS
jgi:outer membrane protein OmpA-like peptidoglycan-associated protein